ncbi:MAG: hypothetical protein PHN75_13480, partial [Syntrophales bacterium]|nr:hypothetical protein [Syntrophales bacterium]
MENKTAEIGKSRGAHAKCLKAIVIILMILAIRGPVFAGGPFGPFQTISREPAGLHTGIGYWYHEDKYKDGSELKIRQHQIYSEVGYGDQKGWDIYARVGISDLKIFDAFVSSSPATTT